ncbi:hypothetical protein R1sor_010858 [Riccia sorocarpa]|uniref:Uncharacterized protein n=1 Tax=Riccia sorocarpa TaxID=122646 RepID=A0ABD3HZ95_9MARC
MRPPRPKYPSDSKNYHKIRRPSQPHTVRLPEELLETYVSLKRTLGQRTSHANIVRFLFEAADAAISAVVQTAEPQSGKRRSPGWISALLELWEEHKNKLQEFLQQRGKPVIVYVDCRFDSSRSGYNGTVPVINIVDDYVIEMVTLTLTN